MIHMLKTTVYLGPHLLNQESFILTGLYKTLDLPHMRDCYIIRSTNKLTPLDCRLTSPLQEPPTEINKSRGKQGSDLTPHLDHYFSSI